MAEPPQKDAGSVVFNRASEGRTPTVVTNGSGTNAIIEIGASLRATPNRVGGASVRVGELDADDPGSETTPGSSDGEHVDSEVMQAFGGRDSEPYI